MPHNPERLKAWQDALHRLMGQIQQWSEEKQWLVRCDQKDIREETTGTYPVPVLTIQTPQGRLRVEPVALDVVGAAGRVDVYSWPHLNQVLLVDFDHGWRVYDQNRAEVISDWDKQAFIKLAGDLTAAAA